MTFTPAARVWFRVENLIHFPDPLLKLLPGLLASQPGYVPDLHPPGAPQGAGLGLHFLKCIWAELEEPVLEGLEDGGVTAGRYNTGGGWVGCIRWENGCSARSRVLVVALYWLSVGLIDRCCILVTVLLLVDSGLSLVQVLNALAGQSISLFRDMRSCFYYA